MVQALVLYRYKKELEGEISVDEGDHIIVLAENSDGWSKISHNGITGFIPTSYFEVTDELHLEPVPCESDISPESELYLSQKTAHEISQIEKAFWTVENYGFALVEENDALDIHRKLYKKHQLGYLKKVDAQRKSWKKELKKKFTPFSWEMKLLCRKGIPPDLRGEVWFKISGAYEKKEKQPDLYRNLKELHYNVVNENTKQIDKDIERTFPDNVFFTSTETKRALRDILRAYSFHNAAIGYCQSMNYLAGMLLFHMSEENAFYTLDAMIGDMYLPPDLFDSTLSGLYRNTYVLTELLRERYPHIHDHIENKGVLLHVFTSKWFMKMFLNTFPMETTLRVWDSFFEEGFKVLYRIALTLLSESETEILACEEVPDVINGIMSKAKEMYDCQQLLTASFGIRRLSHKKITILKEQYDWQTKRRSTM